MKSRLPSRNRVVWFFLALLIIANFAILAYLAFNKPGIIVQQFKGEDGKSGESIQGERGDAGYTPIKGIHYFDGRDGRDGRDAQTVVGPQGPPGNDGVDGTNGTNGVDGTNGRTSEVDCQNGNLVTRYEGDDQWRIIQENSVGCRKGLL